MWVRQNIAATYTPDESIGYALSASVSHNSPKIFEDLARECSRARRSNIALTVLYLKLSSNSKIIQARAPIASIQLRIIQAFRDNDIVGRISDNEIMAVLPGTDYKGARIATERLLHSEQKRKHKESRKLEIGLAQLGPDEKDVQALLERAKQDMPQTMAVIARQ